MKEIVITIKPHNWVLEKEKEGDTSLEGIAHDYLQCLLESDEYSHIIKGIEYHITEK